MTGVLKEKWERKDKRKQEERERRGAEKEQVIAWGKGERELLPPCYMERGIWHS